MDENHLKQKLESNNKVINKKKIPTIFKQKYIEYNKLHKNKYNEIFIVLN